MVDAEGVVAFDLDETLIPHSTVCLHMAPWLGNDDMPRFERLYAEGKITNTELAVADARFYRNRARADACARLSSLPIINGVPETTRWLRQRGLLRIIATITSRFAAEFIQKRFGFDAAPAVCCTRPTASSRQSRDALRR
jgi:phosphoserine phosphatase